MPIWKEAHLNMPWKNLVWKESETTYVWKQCCKYVTMLCEEIYTHTCLFQQPSHFVWCSPGNKLTAYELGDDGRLKKVEMPQELRELAEYHARQDEKKKKNTK